MILSSTNFQNGQNLAKKYTCDGQKIVPHLQWQDFPIKTKAFALILEDPDAVGEKTFVHWLVINIPASITSVNEGSTIIPKASAIQNDSGNTNYVPPCPPSGKHRYIFKIFALDIEQVDGVNKDNFYKKIKANVIDQVEIITYYERI